MRRRSIKNLAFGMALGLLLFSMIAAVFGELSLQVLFVAFAACAFFLGLTYLVRQSWEGWLRGRGYEPVPDAGGGVPHAGLPAPFRSVRLLLAWLFVMPLSVFAIAAVISHEVWLLIPGAFVGLWSSLGWLGVWLTWHEGLEKRGVRW